MNNNIETLHCNAPCVGRLKQVVAMLSQPVATNQHFDGRDYKYAYDVLKSDVESARTILNVEIGKLES